MELQKTYWSNSENSMALHFPITKVNKEKRTVSGFATLDNLDRHGDVVTSEASKKAFDNFRGNIREMHGSSAVGKMVNFKEDNFFDRLYDGFRIERLRARRMINCNASKRGVINEILVMNY